MRILRFAPIALLLVAGCQSTRRVSMRPGSDMALPRSSGVAVTRNSGHTCVEGEVGGVLLTSGNVNHCTPLSPDSSKVLQPARKP